MISPKVMSELHQARLVPTQFTVPKPGEHAWSLAEQGRFWEAIERFPQGPWTAIAAYVGSKSTRQAMTHAQKLRQKLSRWRRRMNSDSVSSTGTGLTTYADSNGSQSPPLSPLEEGNEIAKLSLMGEEDDVDEDDCEPMDIKPEYKHETRQFCSHDQAAHETHDDRYLEHLLSDIEPVLEHVALFTNETRNHDNETSEDNGREQGVYFTHTVATVALEPKTMELSTWNQHHQDSTRFHERQQSPRRETHYTLNEGENYHQI